MDENLFGFFGTEISVMGVKCNWVGLVGLGQLGLFVWLIDKLIDGLVHLILF